MRLEVGVAQESPARERRPCLRILREDQDCYCTVVVGGEETGALHRRGEGSSEASLLRETCQNLQTNKMRDTCWPDRLHGGHCKSACQHQDKSILCHASELGRPGISHSRQTAPPSGAGKLVTSLNCHKQLCADNLTSRALRNPGSRARGLRKALQVLVGRFVTCGVGQDRGSLLRFDQRCLGQRDGGDEDRKAEACSKVGIPFSLSLQHASRDA